MNIFTVFNKMNSQKEYKHLLKDINPLISNLSSSQDVKLCFEWLSKLDKVTPEERDARNEFLKQLKECLGKRKLRHPFSESPPDVPLLEIIPKLTLRTPSNDDEGPDIESQISSKSDPICKYQQRSKKYKSTISRYQSILKEMLDLSVEESCRPAGWEEKPVVCRCDSVLVGHSEPAKTDIIQRVATMEKEVKALRESQSQEKVKKCGKTHAKEKRRRIKQKAMEQIIRTTDLKMSQLEHDLRETTLKELSTEQSQLEKTFIEKVNELEKKYQDKLNAVQDEHKRERDADRQLLEKYQKLSLLPDYALTLEKEVAK